MSYFTITENEYGTCQLCAATVMLKNGSKAPLLRHLKSKHPEVDTILVANSSQSSSDEASSTPITQNTSVNIENIENIPMQVTSLNIETPHVSIFILKFFMLYGILKILVIDFFLCSVSYFEVFLN